MKMKKINSIGYGHKIISISAVFLVVIPGISYLFSYLLKVAGLLHISKVSIAIGLLILLFLFLLLKIEFHQDKKLERYFENNKNTRLLLHNGFYECQACGNRNVKQEQKRCDVCGSLFK
ncbi:hypothetical protein [Lachnoclostridium sp.]|uniref:hypothetical protein n=1 Tax=Lachnoclostridium sp. TaxID=2028282 RepID=UPI00289BEE2E|nr:hypothetical protein [Lachnoclostridium sp.]